MTSMRPSRAIPATPIGVTKHVLKTSRSLGAISFTYHVAPAVSSPQINVPRLLYSNAWAVRNSSMTGAMRRNIERAHDQVIADGVPISYIDLVKQHDFEMSEATEKLAEKLVNSGIKDEYIIPVYGPYKIEGCMGFGFDQEVSKLENATREALETLATSSHVKIVSTFRDQINKVDLSKRETEVLRWLAHGKSQGDIATILGIKSTTVDSYTRRIYAKLGVNTKIAAVLAGISTGKITI